MVTNEENWTNGSDDEVVFEDDETSSLSTGVVTESSSEAIEDPLDEEDFIDLGNLEDIDFGDDELDKLDLDELDTNTDVDTVILSELVETDEDPTQMSKEAAEQLTDRIRATANVMHTLIARAHSGKAYIALGYSTFADYVKEEFSISRSRAYQLLNQAAVIQAIESVAPEGTEVHVTEAAARDLKQYIDEIAPAIAERTEGLTPEEATGVISDTMTELRDKANKTREEASDDYANFNMDDFDLDSLDLDELDIDIPEMDPNRKAGSGGANADDLPGLDDDSDFVGVGGFDNSQVSGTDAMFHTGTGTGAGKIFVSGTDLQMSFNALKAIEDPDEFVKSLNPVHYPYLHNEIDEAMNSLIALKDAWGRYEAVRNSEENNSVKTTDDPFI